MELKDSEALIRSFKKRPVMTISAVVVFLLFLAVIAFLNNYFAEKGKRAAGLSKQPSPVEKPSKNLAPKLVETTPPPRISQHTEGNQAPIVNVSPGGKSIITYGPKSPAPSSPPEKSVSVTSVGQTGGVTANTVNISVAEAQKPRSLSIHDRQGFLGALVRAAKPEVVEIECPVGDWEACTFAEDVRELLLSAAWPVRASVVQAAFRRNPIGIQLVVKNEGIAPPSAQALADAFTAARIAIDARFDSSLHDGTYKLVIGTKPSE